MVCVFLYACGSLFDSCAQERQDHIKLELCNFDVFLDFLFFKEV